MNEWKKYIKKKKKKIIDAIRSNINTQLHPAHNIIMVVVVVVIVKIIYIYI